jgi:SAM-dependent methyltransferase
MLAEVERYYSGKFAEYGATAQGVDWNSSESQQLRFRQLVRVCSKQSFSVVDYGCGYGALLIFLRDCGYEVDYSGLDLSSQMVAYARSAFPEARFVASEEELRPADYAFASGVFNVRLEADERQWSQYVDDTIDRLANLGDVGFAFNMLTSYSDPDLRRPDLFYGDPLYYFDRCKRRYSRHVALLHDYGLWEFTILVRKENSAR